MPLCPGQIYIEIIKVLIKSYFIPLFLLQQLLILLVFLGVEGVPFPGGEQERVALII